MPQNDILQDNMPQDEMPGDNMPPRRHALEMTCPIDDMLWAAFLAGGDIYTEYGPVIR